MMHPKRLFLIKLAAATLIKTFFQKIFSLVAYRSVFPDHKAFYLKT